jgi:hypothetical protein
VGPQLTGTDEAVALAQSLPGGFAAERVLLAADRHQALLVDGHGRLALVSPHGAHFIAHLFEGPVSRGQQDGVLQLGKGHGTARIFVGDQLPIWLDLLRHSGADS